jgi:hypothetical protein
MAKMPKTIGETIDMMFSLRESKRELEAKIKTLNETYDALEAHLTSNFDKAGLDGARGKFATASIKRTTVADVTDWDAYFKYIARTKSWDLIQKRASITALRLRWDDKKAVPGVEPKTLETISLVKAS